jgi:beta-barrel assembly-enhancing protease
MKRALAFVVVVVLGASALYLSQRRNDSTPVSATTVVNTIADIQRDVTRVPMRFTRISDEQEIAIGRELAHRYAGETSTFSPEQKALATYVKTVGTRVAFNAKRKLPYEFHLVPSTDLMNAFALPGGAVFVGEGLLDLMTSEDELANVLAHEIEHIDHYHAAERVQVETQLRRLHLGILGELAQIPFSVWQIGYNKDQEMEADREGIRLAVRSGYSPYGAVRMFERFARLHDEYVIHARTPGQELSQLAVQSITGYFRSHPQSSERIAQANRIIAEQHWTDRKQQKPFRIGYEIKSAQAAR